MTTTREPYMMSEEEIQILLQGVATYGEKETYLRMQQKAMAAMMQVDFVDDMIMDMYETVLKRAREFDAAEDDEEDMLIKNGLYQIASMLRFTAHDVHRFLTKHGKASETGRFLELANYEESIPNRTWR